jgi:hypothetical protein
LADIGPKNKIGGLRWYLLRRFHLDPTHILTLCPQAGRQIQCGYGGEPGTSIHARRTVRMTDLSSLIRRIDPDSGLT